MPLILSIFIFIFTSFKVNANPNFLDFKVNPKQHEIKLYLKDSNDHVFGQFNSLEKYLDSKNQKLVFAMNAGMFMENLLPLGLYIENGVLLKKLNLRKNAHGNFYMQPNGVFSVTHKGVHIDTTLNFRKKDVLFATQSGPMLIVNNKLNPSLDRISTSKVIRNGVCLDNSMHVVFSISSKPVSFFEMAQHFKNELECKNALYLDGAISQIYWPETGHFGKSSLIGPIVGVTLLEVN